MSRPIPKRLLPDSISYEKKTDASRGNLYDAPVVISNVLVRKKQKFVRTNEGYVIVGKAVLVYDYTNSDPNDIDIAYRDKITFDGVEYTVQEGDEQPTLSGKHHREIILL